MRPTRKKRLDDLFREILADLLLTKASDPRLSLATITSVRISPELDVAKVFVSVLGGEEKRSEVLDALRRAAPFLRSELAREVRVRRTPELRFVFDESMEQGLRMDRVLREIADERAERTSVHGAGDAVESEGADDDAR